MPDFADLLAALPLWGAFACTLLLCVGSEEIGHLLARAALQRRPEREPDGPLGSMVGSLLGLLAFTVGFTFAMAGGRFDTRKELVLQESNAIGTTYLRAALLPPAEGLEIRRLLREYTDVRLSIANENAAQVVTKSERIHGQLWQQARKLVDEPMDSEIRSLFIDSLNGLIDLHQMRKTHAFQYRVPGVVWLMLYLLTTLSMLAVGYQGGMSGARRLRGAPVLALAFSLVLLMIADLDRPTQGMLSVSQQPLRDVQASMAGDSP
jgi:hypothetical protein